MAKPNILLIVADDLGVDALRIVNGQVTAQIDASAGTTKSPQPLPTLGKLVRSGVHFSHAWAHPVCTPTRGSLFTGLMPWKHKLGFPEPSGNGELPATDATGSAVSMLPQILNQQGYRCAMFGKWDLGTEITPTQRGWNHFEGIYDGGLRLVAENYYGMPQNTPGRVPLGALQALTDAGTKPQRDAAIESCRTYLQKVSPGFVETQPDVRYFVWKKSIEDQDGTKREEWPHEREHLYATIDQIEGTKRWIAEQGSAPWCVALTLIIPHDPFHMPPDGSYQLQLADPSKPTLQEMFIAMVESVDHYIGQLLDAPELREQLANTVIVFVGDNGTQDRDPETAESLDDDLQDKNSHYIGGVHVPMVVADGAVYHGRAPIYLRDAQGRSTAGTSTTSLVHITDLYQTAIDIAGGSAAGPTDSVSMQPHLRHTEQARRHYVFSQQYPNPSTPRVVGKHASVSDGTYKLSCVRTVPPPPVRFQPNANPSGDEFQFFLSKLEPSAKIPGALDETPLDLLAPEHSGKARELYAELREHRLDSGGSEGPEPKRFPPLPLPAVPASPSLHQFAASPMGSATYAHGFNSIPTMKIMGAPADADLRRWAMLHDNMSYYFTCMRRDRDDTLYVFGWNGSAYQHGAGPLRQLEIAPFPAGTDSSTIGLLHDNFGSHLLMRRRGAEPAFVRASLQGDTFRVGGDGMPTVIPVVGFPADADWGRWTVLHDNGNYLMATMVVGETTRLYRGQFDPRSNRYAYLDQGQITGAPSTSDFSSFAMLHDNRDYRLYMQSR